MLGTQFLTQALKEGARGELLDLLDEFVGRKVLFLDPELARTLSLIADVKEYFLHKGVFLTC